MENVPVAIGDYVRSYDFFRNEEAYVEGFVRAIAPWEHCEFRCSLDHYHIEVLVDTLTTIDSEFREWVYPVCTDTSSRPELEFISGSKVVVLPYPEGWNSAEAW